MPPGPALIARLQAAAKRDPLCGEAAKALNEMIDFLEHWWRVAEDSDYMQTFAIEVERFLNDFDPE
jgi:hypothetical protein